MLPFCLLQSSHLSIKKISAPDSGLSGHPAFDPHHPLAVEHLSGRFNCKQSLKKEEN
jgi:hypothetical protein